MNELKANIGIFALLAGLILSLALMGIDGAVTRYDWIYPIIIGTTVLAVWLGVYSAGWLLEMWRDE